MSDEVVGVENCEWASGSGGWLGLRSAQRSEASTTWGCAELLWLLLRYTKLLGSTHGATTEELSLLASELLWLLGGKLLWLLSNKLLRLLWPELLWLLEELLLWDTVKLWWETSREGSEWAAIQGLANSSGLGGLNLGLGCLLNRLESKLNTWSWAGLGLWGGLR